jgi:hypothetical protein
MPWPKDLPNGGGGKWFLLLVFIFSIKGLYLYDIAVPVL